MFAVLLCFTIDCFYGYFYPVKYKEQITQYASFFAIKPALVASVINVESSYKEKRVSSKGAIGLMQIMPTTAQWICEKQNLNFKEIDLYDIDTNIKFGSYYLSYLYDYFQDFDLCICAYNAGIGNVKKWMQNVEFFEKGELKKIPFTETKNYLRKVSKNLRYYEKKY